MKIIAALAVGLSLVTIEGVAAPGAEYPRAYLSENQVWLQQSASEAPFQATHDCAAKSDPAISPDGKRIVYGVSCVGKDQLLSPMNLVILDLAGHEVARFTSLPMKKVQDGCTQGDHLQWADNHHIAIDCELNPSLADHLVVNSQTGEVEREYLGLWFTWSPDHKAVAYVGFIVHFAPPIAQNYCLLLNERTIYTPNCSNQAKSDDGRSFRDIHTFAYPLLWSPDSRKIAFVEEVFDWGFDPAPNETGSGKSSRERYYLVIASANQPARGYPVKKIEYARMPSLQWISASQIKLNGKLYEFAKNKPGVIP